MPNDNVRAMPRQPEDNFTDVVIRVPDKTMADSWADLERPMMDSPDYEHMLCEVSEGGSSEWSFEEGELRLLVGAFVAASGYLPMGPFEYVRWIDRFDEKLSGRQYINEFVGNRMVEDPPLFELNDDQLDELVARIPEAKSERAKWNEERDARARETERRKNPDQGSKQAAIESALADASIGETWNALANSFKGEELSEISYNLEAHVDYLQMLAAQIEAA
ncbi:hypothetical protein [Erythrobacter donghaensis]|uniref:hypothetical protein n=1 Tax=Erythrobacter donghaensis TaxID=267135 RepID=UPI00117E7A68|nr:hypothetical protein [Erythrobacter donghaensis]